MANDQQKKVRMFRDEIQELKAFWVHSMANTDEVVASQTSLVEYIISNVLETKKSYNATSVMNAIIDQEPKGSEYEMLIYWDKQVKIGLDLCQKKWAKNA